MSVREEDLRGVKIKRIVVQKASADALKIAAFAEQHKAVYSDGIIYVEFVHMGKAYRTELPTRRTRRAMNRYFESTEPRQSGEKPDNHITVVVEADELVEVIA